MRPPFFSVIIPTYNRLNLLKAAVDSVLEQSYDDFELIIVDNGSTDGTGDWLKNNYSDARIQYHYQLGTGSPAGPRNTGINLASGEWVCFLDSDDHWCANKLEVVKREIDKAPEFDVHCHDEIQQDILKNSSNILRYGPYEENFYRALLISGNRLSTSAVSIRRFFLNQNHLYFNENPSFIIVEDYDYWLHMAKKGAHFNFIHEALGTYYLNHDSLSINSQLKRQNTMEMLKHHVYSVQSFTLNKDRLWDCVRFRYQIGDLIKNKKSRGAFQMVLKIINKALLNPFCFLMLMKFFLTRKLFFK